MGSKADQELDSSFNRLTLSSEDDIGDSEFPHVLEIYDFPNELKTSDLMSAVATAGSKDFYVKWVDDTHALAVFSNEITANQALKASFHVLKLRPISKGIKESKLIARQSAEKLLPYKERPQTSATIAHRLVTQSLGMKSNVTPEQRSAERKKLQDAKEKRKQMKQQSIDVWEGNVD